MSGIIRWLSSIFAWRVVRNSGAWLYYENNVTGKRKVIRIAGSGYQPLDKEWLDK